MNRRHVLPLFMVTLLLSGCWDEHNIVNTINVPMIGISGKPSELVVSFALPAVERKTEESRTITVQGESFQDAKAAANATTHNKLETTMLTALILEDAATTENIYAYLDSFYRDVRNRLGMAVILSDGPANIFIDLGREFGDNINTFYDEMVSHLIFTSQLPDMDLQIACTYLLDGGMDLQLPFMRMSEENKFPEISGVAMFNDKKFTGEIIPLHDMVHLQLLKDDLGQRAFDTFLYKDAPLSYEIDKVNRNVVLEDKKVEFTYEIVISVLDYFPDRLAQSDTRKGIEKELSEDMHTRATEIMKTMQNVEHDGLGLGRYYRAYKPELYEVSTWKEYYSELEVEFSFDITLRDSGIID